MPLHSYKDLKPDEQLAINKLNHLALKIWSSVIPVNKLTKRDSDKIDSKLLINNSAYALMNSFTQLTQLSGSTKPLTPIEMGALMGYFYGAGNCDIISHVTNLALLHEYDFEPFKKMTTNVIMDKDAHHSFVEVSFYREEASQDADYSCVVDPWIIERYGYNLEQGLSEETLQEHKFNAVISSKKYIFPLHNNCELVRLSVNPEQAKVDDLKQFFSEDYGYCLYKDALYFYNGLDNTIVAINIAGDFTTTLNFFPEQLDIKKQASFADLENITQLSGHKLPERGQFDLEQVNTKIGINGQLTHVKLNSGAGETTPISCDYKCSKDFFILAKKHFEEQVLDLASQSFDKEKESIKKSYKTNSFSFYDLGTKKHPLKKSDLKDIHFSTNKAYILTDTHLYYINNKAKNNFSVPIELQPKIVSKIRDKMNSGTIPDNLPVILSSKAKDKIEFLASYTPTSNMFSNFTLKKDNDTNSVISLEDEVHEEILRDHPDYFNDPKDLLASALNRKKLHIEGPEDQEGLRLSVKAIKENDEIERCINKTYTMKSQIVHFKKQVNPLGSDTTLDLLGIKSGPN